MNDKRSLKEFTMIGHIKYFSFILCLKNSMVQSFIFLYLAIKRLKNIYFVLIPFRHISNKFFILQNGLDFFSFLLVFFFSYVLYCSFISFCCGGDFYYFSHHFFLYFPLPAFFFYPFSFVRVRVTFLPISSLSSLYFLSFFLPSFHSLFFLIFFYYPSLRYFPFSFLSPPLYLSYSLCICFSCLLSPYPFIFFSI